MLYFWYACEGVRQQWSSEPNSDPSQFRQLIRAIYKRFVRPRRRGGRATAAAAAASGSEREPAELPLSEDVRGEIAERVQEGRLDPEVFDGAQAEVEAEMNRTLYPNFLKSDYYIQLVQGSAAAAAAAEGEGSYEGSSCASSVCGPPCPAAGLPTLHEEHESSAPGSTTGSAAAGAGAGAAGQSGVAVAPALTRGALLATQDKRALIQPTGRRKPDKSTTAR